MMMGGGFSGQYVELPTGSARRCRRAAWTGFGSEGGALRCGPGYLLPALPDLHALSHLGDPLVQLVEVERECVQD